MTTRSRGPLAGFGWLMRGIKTGFRHPKALFGGAAILGLACLLPSLLTLPLQWHGASAGTPPTPAVLGGSMAISLLVSLLLVPLYAGYMQVVDAAERGLPARARDVFAPYRQGQARGLIGYGLAMMVTYVLMIAIVVAVAGGGLIHWYTQALDGQIHHRVPAAGLPDGFATAVVLFSVMALFLTGFYAISLGQVALRRRGVFAALGDGLAGALKNLLPLLAFAVAAGLAAIVLMIAVTIAVLVLALLAKLVGAWLMIVLGIPVYLALLLVIFTSTFGAMYHLWRDVCSDEVASGMAATVAA